jgi:hypothetical protein
MAEQGECMWVGTGARGVYTTSCRDEGVLGVPPKICPYCCMRVVQPQKTEKPRSITDYQKWKASQASGGTKP